MLVMKIGRFSRSCGAGVRVLGAAAALLVATQAVSAAALTWNNAGGTGDGVTWDINTNQNWNDGTNPAVFNSGDDVTFSDANNGHYAVSLPGSVNVNTFSATNTADTYVVTIADSQTLTVNGQVSIGQTTLQLATNVILTGSGGGFSQTAGDLTVSMQNALGNPAPKGNLDASGLTQFTYNAPTNQVQIGVGARTLGTLELANTGNSVNSITAASVRIGDSVPRAGGSTGNSGGTSVVTLGGGNNFLNADTFTIGNGKASGVLQGTAGGSVTIAGTGGGTTTANITVGRASSASGGGANSQLLLAGMDATVYGNTVIIGYLNGGTSKTAQGTATFDTGTFSAVSLQVGADASGTNPDGLTASFTLGTDGTSTGTLNATAMALGNVTTTATTVKADAATFTINGGTANIGGDLISNNAAPATTTLTTTLVLAGGTLNMNGNQIGHATGNNVHISKVTMPISGQTATLASLGGTGINDAGLTVDGGGTLVLAGTNTYSGGTAVTVGTLLVDGAHTGGGVYTVSSGATLGGKGSTTSAVTVNAGGTLSPGDSINTLGVGSVVLNGLLEIQLDDSSSQATDLLNAVGSLDISGTSAVDFSAAGTLGGSAYVFATYGELTGSAFAAATNVPSGYTIDYHYQGNQIALVAASVPEPASVALLGLGAVGLLKRRRR